MLHAQMHAAHGVLQSALLHLLVLILQPHSQQLQHCVGTQRDRPK
jgi:hypothetical protein